MKVSGLLNGNLGVMFYLDDALPVEGIAQRLLKTTYPGDLFVLREDTGHCHGKDQGFEKYRTGDEMALTDAVTLQRRIRGRPDDLKRERGT